MDQASAWDLVRCLNFELSLHLHTYFVYVSSEGSDESAHLYRLIWAFIVWQCDKYQNLLFCLQVNDCGYETEKCLLPHTKQTDISVLEFSEEKS